MRYRCAQGAVLLAFAAAVFPGCDTRTEETPPTAAAPSAPARQATGAARPAADRTPAPRTNARPNEVVIDNFAYAPRTLTVAAGTRVTWVNRDDVPHTVTSTAKPRSFDSGALDTDATFAFVFTTPGTYEYFCTVHPHMTARVIVK
jgi:plastocyanin